GCQIGDNTIVGMGSIIMDGSKIGKNCLIGAGSLIATNKEFPDNSLIFGNPARVKRPLTQEELDIIADSAVTCMNDGLEMTAQGVF
ncbi:MAG: gamma carbonic anhydrase family protein, partial [Eubacterium sp.]|nr:gamma carbonic anhydrase family protein [Eubacterium sp.]